MKKIINYTMNVFIKLQNYTLIKYLLKYFRKKQNKSTKLVNKIKKENNYNQLIKKLKKYKTKIKMMDCCTIQFTLTAVDEGKLIFILNGCNPFDQFIETQSNKSLSYLGIKYNDNFDKLRDDIYKLYVNSKLSESKLKTYLVDRGIIEQ